MQILKTYLIGYYVKNVYCKTVVVAENSEEAEEFVITMHKGFDEEIDFNEHIDIEEVNVKSVVLTKTVEQ